MWGNGLPNMKEEIEDVSYDGMSVVSYDGMSVVEGGSLEDASGPTELQYSNSEKCRQNSPRHAIKRHPVSNAGLGSVRTYTWCLFADRSVSIELRYRDPTELHRMAARQ
ncbi:hypothetical protein Acr_23g0018330 [Actinidia rufa]|uniref:Uncharacterized protein n=1 Tax=Actinidia rufa TaxID=165716 RepID=A0A7J0GRR3_9ERIC|nr:hypothetical protein Acr_23g0018330 [Actinidia rufa]